MEQTNKLANKNELALLFLSFGTFCREAPSKEMCCQINSILAKYHESVIINLGLSTLLKGSANRTCQTLMSTILQRMSSNSQVVNLIILELA